MHSDHYSIQSAWLISLSRLVRTLGRFDWKVKANFYICFCIVRV
jgi:hypothetical protein